MLLSCRNLNRAWLNPYMETTTEPPPGRADAGEAVTSRRVAPSDFTETESWKEHVNAPDAAAAAAPRRAGDVHPPAVERLVSLDAYRGLVMVLMVSAGLGIPAVVRNFERTPGLGHLKTPLWDRLAFHTDHVPWV